MRSIFRAFTEVGHAPSFPCRIIGLSVVLIAVALITSYLVDTALR